ncbi:MAG: hypothetical protein Q8M73_00165 [Actinomycetota bacterium]|nr:hypothetical protein [Actinomycetota bacterium]
MASDEAWTTDEALAEARTAIAAKIPGYRTPAAYALARMDGSELEFGHINRIGEVRGLPAAALALECGYSDETGVYRMTCNQVAAVLECLAPAEAATHVPHPNIWTWSELLLQAQPDSSFLAFFLADAEDIAATHDEAQFQAFVRAIDRATTY